MKRHSYSVSAVRRLQSWFSRSGCSGGVQRVDASQCSASSCCTRGARSTRRLPHVSCSDQYHPPGPPSTIHPNPPRTSLSCKTKTQTVNKGGVSNSITGSLQRSDKILELWFRIPFGSFHCRPNKQLIK